MQRVPGHFGRIDDACFHQVDILAGGNIVTFVTWNATLLPVRSMRLPAPHSRRVGAAEIQQHGERSQVRFSRHLLVSHCPAPSVRVSAQRRRLARCLGGRRLSRPLPLAWLLGKSTLSDQRVAKIRGDGNLKTAIGGASRCSEEVLISFPAEHGMPNLSGTPRPKIQYFFKNIALLRKSRDMYRRGCSVANHENRDTEV